MERTGEISMEANRDYQIDQAFLLKAECAHAVVAGPVEHLDFLRHVFAEETQTRTSDHALG